MKIIIMLVGFLLFSCTDNIIVEEDPETFLEMEHLILNFEFNDIKSTSKKLAPGVEYKVTYTNIFSFVWITNSDTITVEGDGGGYAKMFSYQYGIWIVEEAFYPWAINNAEPIKFEPHRSFNENNRTYSSYYVGTGTVMVFKSFLRSYFLLPAYIRDISGFLDITIEKHIN